MTAPHASLISWRRKLHQHPELSGDEAWTADQVAQRLSALGPEFMMTGIGGHGVVAGFGPDTAARKILIRCELDALPIPEIGTHDHRSQIPDRGHLCGHDGHMAIVMGVAERIHAAPVPDVQVLTLFQPAEETGAGAQAMVQDPRIAALRPDMAVALHNMPGLPLGEVHVKDGVFARASQGLQITLSGTTAHAAQPESGVSPAMALTELIQAMAGLNVPPNAPRDKMATVTHARLGEATFGVAPGHAEMWVTLRTVDNANMTDLRRAAQDTARRIADHHGLRVEMQSHDVFPASVNHPDVTNRIIGAARDAGLPCHILPEEMRWSEDFGHFAALCPSAMFLLGAGVDTPALHNPDYDFPDALIDTGVTMFMEIIRGLSS